VIDSIVFFGLFAFSIFLYWKHQRKPKKPTFILDPEKHKCESPIERGLYEVLRARGEYIEAQVKY
jgi:hypothetical protein